MPRLECRQRTPIYPINRVAAFDRNRWPLWIGMGGRLPSESLAALPRIPQMSIENPLWGAPRIHGELLKLGVEGAQSSVAKYMVKRRGPSSQGWRTFLRNHAPDIAAMDLFVVSTFGFDLLYASSSSAWTAEISSGSMSQQTRRQNGLRGR